MKELSLNPTSNTTLSIPRGTPRMTSVQLAELTGKQHKHVMRDIRTLIDQEAITQSNFGLSEYKDDSGKSNPMYFLDFQASMVLVTGYDARKRSAVINRWMVLEQGIAAPQLPTNYKEALVQLLEQVEENERLQETVRKITPKADALDRISTADGFENITNTAKALQVRPKELFAYLSAHQWIYRRPGGRGWIAYQTRIQQGLLTHKVTTVQLTDGTERMIENVLVTPKGLAKLAQVFSVEVAA